jgi:hypothetical protein
MSSPQKLLDTVDNILGELGLSPLTSQQRATAIQTLSNGVSASSGTTRISPIQAAMQDQRSRAAAQYAVGMARRLNIDLHDGDISMIDLNNQLSDRRVEPERRMELKASLAAAGLID